MSDTPSPWMVGAILVLVFLLAFLSKANAAVPV